MAEAKGIGTQIVTRIPKALHRQLRMRCIRAGVSMMDFVAAAITEHLARHGRRRSALARES